MRREDVRRRRDVCEETKEACDACASRRACVGVWSLPMRGNRRGVHVGRSGPVDRSILRSRTQTKIPYEITRTVLIRFIWVFSLNRISATAWSRSARSVATTMTWWGVPPPRSTSTRASSRLTPRKRSRRPSRASSSARRRRPVVATANPTPARAANASVGNPKGKRAERKGRFSRVG